MLIVTTNKQDVYRNLALEEWLLDHAPGLPILFLYVNEPCVVIGKNQNPWRECRVSLMREQGVPLARRISGGGAVVHDAGNLNFSVLVPRVDYCEQKQVNLIFQTLETFGITAEKLGKSSLAIAGKKFSGQAFCHRRDRTLHHGTLLVHSDLNRLGRYLGSEVEGIETHAIASVPAPVMNLSDVNPSVTVDSLSRALITTFEKMYDGASAVELWTDSKIPEQELLPRIEMMSSEAWLVERTPRFSVQVDGHALRVEKGRVVNLDGTPRFSQWIQSEPNSRSASISD